LDVNRFGGAAAQINREYLVWRFLDPLSKNGRAMCVYQFVIRLQAASAARSSTDIGCSHVQDRTT